MLSHATLRRWNGAFAVAVCIIATLTVCGAAPAETEEAIVLVRGGQRSAPVTPRVVDADVRDLPRPRDWQPGDPVRNIPQRFFAEPGSSPPATPADSGIDPLLDRQLRYTSRTVSSSDSFTQPTRNLRGLSFTGSFPPDTVGDVGPAHFIQSVNGFSGGSSSARVRIYDKGLVPGALATFNMEDLGGGSCLGFADPIVLYDRQADRWLLAEIGFNNSVCVYVSQTGDPVSGGWYVYEFFAPVLPDYPKLGVWATDANGGNGSYTMVTNEGDPSVIWALDRGQMLAGAAATSQRFTVPRLASFTIPAPADVDGANGPPVGDPAIFMRPRDTELNDGPASPGDVLEMWWLDVDWIDPGNSTLSSAPSIDVAEFDSDICNLVTACFEQPDGAPPLQPLNWFLMHRLQYMNRVSHESLAGNFTIDVDGTDQGGIRWFELRRTAGGPWTLHQEGTYAIDDDNRWVGALAADAAGNLALGFNVVSSTTYPSLRYTGRRSFDSHGVMTQTETVIGPGTGSEGSERYGDYAAMSLDPLDDCTFWLTGEFSTGAGWLSQIATFRFEGCPCDIAPDAPTVQAVAPEDNRIDVTWTDSASSGAMEYLVQRSLVPGGPYTTLATVPDTSPGAGGGPGYLYQDTDVSGGVTYYYVVTVLDTTSCPSPPAVEAGAEGTGACVLAPAFDGLQVATSGGATCAIDLTWSPATAYCGGPVVYDLFRSTTPGFVPSVANLLASGLTGTAATDANGLIEGQEYHYVVRAIDLANGVQDPNTIYRTTTATGLTDMGIENVFSEEFEAPDVLQTNWSVGTGPGTHVCGEWERVDNPAYQPPSGEGFYALSLSDGCAATSTFLDSPVIDLSGAQNTQLWTRMRVNVGFGGEFASVEAWNGQSWEVVDLLDAGSSKWGLFSYDVSAQADGNPQFQVRYNYQDASNADYFAIDDVDLYANVVLGAECITSSGVAPVPDGSGGTTALQASRLDVPGSRIDVVFDAAACPAPAYNLLFGALAGVDTLTLDGGVCGIGAGSFEWVGVPSGDLFFLAVGFDGAESESRWGEGELGERNGLTASGECGATLKNISSTCP